MWRRGLSLAVVVPLIASNSVGSKTTQGEASLVDALGGTGQDHKPWNNAGVPTFSSLGVPAPAGMSDWYENDVTPTNGSIPAKAGIQRGGDGRGRLALNRFYGPTPFLSLGLPASADMSDW